ncbi:hypothetical protein ACUNWD_10890 [Sunxiuqinia sp. A32]|uniref:hypothetical protein n=1 Tax=Sunxiuqinia sp. A32 TaxID=3461496 RepID=UPI0040461E92
METQIKHEQSISPIVEKKQRKLIRSFPKYLESKRKSISRQFGTEAADKIFAEARKVYPEIVIHIRSFQTPMYDALMVTASKMAAIKKGMNAIGISTEQFIRFSIEDTRSTGEKVPSFLLRFGGKVYLSKLMRRYLKKVGKSVSKNGWPTEVIDGTKSDDFEMSIETRNCQMVAFWEAIGEGDIRPYCTFFDFTSAELLGIGLKQVSTIDTGVCKYCLY